MPDVSMTIEMKEFQAALRQYAHFRKKDDAYIVNRSALNLTIKGAQETPLADRGAIRALSSKPWWPKYVAKRLTSKAGVKIRRRQRGKVIATETLRFNRQRGANAKHYTLAQARKASRAIIEARLKRRGYLKSGWGAMIKKLSQLKLRMRLMGTTANTGHIRKKPGDATPARAGFNPEAQLFIGHHIAKPMQTILRRALLLAANDMRTFIKERYLSTAKKVAPKTRG